MASRHCPYCNSTTVAGIGALFEGGLSTSLDKMQIVVEMHCLNCGRQFVSEDRRSNPLRPSAG